MYTNSKLAKAVRLALIYGASATTFGGISAANAQDEDEAAVDRTERIQVTGSRIQRTDMEGAVPMTVIDRADIDMSGEISVADVIRGTTFNTAGSFRPQSGSATQGVSTVNMRGLGADRTLVLLDGRRLPKSSSTGSSQDLNVVPLAAVERIEILSDGASAVYGSDAIGGVINIITRRDFEGAELRYGRSEVSLPADGGDREEGSVVFGTSTDRTRIIGGASWSKRDIIFHRDYSWVTPGGSIYGNNWAEYDPVEDDFVGSFRSLPNSPEACESTENFIFNESAGSCAYNFNATNANEASTGNKGLFLKADHQINSDWTIFANASYSKTESFGRYAPSLNDPFGVLSADSINNPTNPNASPLIYTPEAEGDEGARDVTYRHRFASLGNRDSYVDVHSHDLMVFTEGRVGDFDVDFGVRQSISETYDQGYNYLLRSAADSAANITADEVAAGLMNDADFVYYDLADPLGSRYAGNTAQEDNYQNLLSGMNVTIARRGFFEQREVFGSAAFDVAEIGAGYIQTVVGFEYREEDYSDRYDSLSEAGQVGGSSGNSAGGGRDVTAAYAEVLIPVTYDLEVSLAGRYDDYSDYGSDFSPKASFRWQPMQELVVRGSYGQGFRAPSLDQVTMQDSSGNPAMSDPATCIYLTGDTDCDVQVRQITRANPNLESEESEQFALGVAYQPTEWLNLAVDYWNISIDNRIGLFGLNTLLTREAAGDAIPEGVGIRRGTGDEFCYDQAAVGAGNPTCAIVGVDGGYANDGTFDTDGFDLNVRTNFDFAEFGSLRQNFQLSYTNSRKIDGGENTVRNPGVPEYRATISNMYRYNDFDFTWNINVIGNQYNTFRGTDDDGNHVPRSGNIATWTTHDLQLAYNAPWDGVFSVGMRNAFEKVPQLGTNTQARGTRDYNFDLYDAYGRVTYFRYTQRF